MNDNETWTLTFGGDADTMVDMRTFVKAHNSGQKFYWTPPAPYNVQGTWIFNEDSFKPKVKYGCDGTNFGIQGYTVSLTFRRCYQ